MIDLVLMFASYAVPIVGTVVVLGIFGFLFYKAFTWNRVERRPGYIPIYDRDKERLPL